MGQHTSVDLTIDGQHLTGMIDDTGNFICAIGALNGGALHSISREVRPNLVGDPA